MTMIVARPEFAGAVAGPGLVTDSQKHASRESLKYPFFLYSVDLLQAAVAAKCPSLRVPIGTSSATRSARILVADELVGPLDEILPVRTVGVSAVVLPPRQLAVEETDIYRRHPLFHVVIGRPEIPRTE